MCWILVAEIAHPRPCLNSALLRGLTVQRLSGAVPDRTANSSTILEMPNLERETMDRETLNDRFKRALHRVVARALVTRPEMLSEARRVVAAWKCAETVPEFVREWDELLARDLVTIRRQITQRTELMTRLRISSPFYHLPRWLLDGQRKRLWRIISAQNRKRPAADGAPPRIERAL